VWGTVHSAGPFVTSDLSQSLLLLQLFIAVLAITVLIISAIVAERKDADQRKDDFIALTSHELKTPVTSLKMFTQVLAHKLQKLGEADISSSLSRMDVQLNKLTRVIQDLLDASRLNLGKLEYNIEAFSVNNLVSEVVEDMQRVSEKHPLSLKFQPIQEIMGDKDRIRQVLINLINNAIKYSADGEKIVIIVTQDEGSARVSIQDFGIGISKAHQNKIFERFYQASKNRSSGLGVGLYICKEIIERHKGKIWVESEENKGSTFYFTLPFKTLSLEAVK